MGRMRLSAVVAFGICIASTALAASDAADSAYWDFRIPAHRWSQWAVGLAASGENSEDSGPGDQRSREGSLRGQLFSTASGGSESDPLFQSWRATMRLDGSRSHSELDRVDPFQTSRDESWSRSTSANLNASYVIRAYPWAFPLGFSSNLSTGLGKSHSFQSFESGRWSAPDAQQDEFTTSTGRWNVSASLGIGTGLGRVRDVTPVHEAQVLEERLLATGALSRPLSRPAREKLAGLFAAGDGISFAHGRPDKYFWGELERVLSDDGALAGGSLDLYSAHKILEPRTLRGRMVRSAGFFIGPAVSLNTRQVGRNSESRHASRFYEADTLAFESGSRTTSHRVDRQDEITTRLDAEFHHPSGPRWQYDLMQTVWIGESGSPVESSTWGRVAWIVTDRWLVTGSIDHRASWTGDGHDQSVEDWSFRAAATLSYFLEDSWAISLSAGEGQHHTRTAFDRGGDVFLGITRVISGLFDAPGLVAAMRPIPGGR